MGETITRMPLRVRFHECDPQGIVFNAHYLAYCDMACNEAVRTLFGSLGGMHEAGADFVVAESNVRYLASARFDEELVIDVSVARLGTTSMSLAFTVLRGDETITVATNRYVFVDPETLVKAAPPEDVRAKFAALLTDGT